MTCKFMMGRVPICGVLGFRAGLTVAEEVDGEEVQFRCEFFILVLFSVEVGGGGEGVDQNEGGFWRDRRDGAFGSWLGCRLDGGLGFVLVGDIVLGLLGISESCVEG